MMYLATKMVAYLTGALITGFAMGWLLQHRRARKLRRELNSVVLDTKKKIPALEGEVANRDLQIRRLEEKMIELREQPGFSQPADDAEHERQIAELQQRIIDLETELQSHAQDDDEPLLDLPDDAGLEIDDEELQSDDEFLSDISDIFEEDGDPSLNDPFSADDDVQNSGEEDGGISESEFLDADLGAPDADKDQAAELRDQLEALQARCDSNEKTVTVLNQQLELARLANERILRELQEYKEGDPTPGDDIATA
ncbi:MAG: hypothetical protein AAF515_15475 [Pseudomonadota bacterium]